MARSRRRRFWRWTVALLAITVSVVTVTGIGYADLMYFLIAWNKKADDARPYAERLLRSPRGIALAARDVHVFSWETRGWGEWILVNSALDSTVESSLGAVLADPAADSGQKMGANLIMWQRTQKKKYLEAFFVLVQSSGGSNVRAGRNRLATVFKDEKTQKLFDVPESKPLPMSLEEFGKLISSNDVFSAAAGIR